MALGQNFMVLARRSRLDGPTQGRSLNDHVAWPLIHTNMTSKASQAKGCLVMWTASDEKEDQCVKCHAECRKLGQTFFSPSLFSWTRVICILSLVIGVTLRVTCSPGPIIDNFFWIDLATADQLGTGQLVAFGMARTAVWQRDCRHIPACQIMYS